MSKQRAARWAMTAAVMTCFGSLGCDKTHVAKPGPRPVGAVQAQDSEPPQIVAAPEAEKAVATPRRHAEFGVPATSPTTDFAAYISRDGELAVGGTAQVVLTIAGDPEITVQDVSVRGMKGVVAQRVSGPAAVRDKPGHHQLTVSVQTARDVAGYIAADVQWRRGTDSKTSTYMFKFFAKGARYTTPPMGKIVTDEDGQKIQVMPATSR